MSFKDLVRRAERQSKQSINESYRSIDHLYLELDFLNDLLNKYNNKKSGLTYSRLERLEKMGQIRERIPEIYQDINYYKECINADKKEIKRIHETYGYCNEPTYYEEYEYELAGINELAAVNELVAVNEDELEEIREYKYNPITGVFE